MINELSLEYTSIRDFVEEQGIEHFYDCDRGIGHQIISELVRPGMLVAGSDSHTATAGAFNTLAVGINKTETAVLWKTGKMWFRVPETVKIVLKNRLPERVFAKDSVSYNISEPTRLLSISYAVFCFRKKCGIHFLA